MAFICPWSGWRALSAGAFLAMCASGSWTTCSAQSDAQALEYKVKAAFLYRFASYVEWPPQVLPRADSPLVIGVIGADALGDELAQVVADRTVAGRPVTVRKLRRGEALTGVHVLFIGRSDAHRSADVLAAAKGKAVLTVTESEDAFALGSVINFVLLDDKVRFDVALRPAEMENLKISARLLSVARKVIPSPS
jgi:hypothetical protein